MTAPRRGLSLIEVVIVMAIVGLLTALALPGLQRARLAATRARCLSNLKNQAVAVLTYEQHRGKLPTAAIVGPYEPLGVPDGASHGLWTQLLPFLDQPQIAADYRWDVSFDHDDNQTVASAVLPTLLCPAVDGGSQVGLQLDADGQPTRWAGTAHYGPLAPSKILVDQGLVDPEADLTGPLTVNTPSKSTDIKDGASNTILLVELGRTAAWASPDTLSGVAHAFPGGGGPPGGAPHIEGLPVAFCDGSARLIPWSVSRKTFAGLSTRAGGEAVSVEW